MKTFWHYIYLFNWSIIALFVLLIVSADESYQLCVYICPLPLQPPSHPSSQLSRSSQRQSAGWAPWAVATSLPILQVEVCMLTRQGFSLSSSHSLPSPTAFIEVRSLCLCLYSHLANRFISLNSSKQFMSHRWLAVANCTVGPLFLEGTDNIRRSTEAVMLTS